MNRGPGPSIHNSHMCLGSNGHGAALIISSQANSFQRKGQTNGVDLVDGFRLAESEKMVKVVLYKLTADCLSTSHRSKNPLDDSVTAFMSTYAKSRIR